MKEASYKAESGQGSEKALIPEPLLPTPALLDYKGTSRIDPIPACAVSLEDLRWLYGQLNAKALSALNTYLATIPPLANKTQEEDAALRNAAREIGQLTVTITGGNGEQRVGQSIDYLLKENLPAKVTGIIFDSCPNLEQNQIFIHNKFRLELDFTEPPGFNEYNPIDRPTPNKSGLQIIAQDDNWASGVSECVTNFFKNKTTARSLLHDNGVFAFLAWFIFMPISLWVAYRVDSIFISQFPDIHTALRGSLNVYIVFLTFLILRGGSWAIRWAYPVIELEGCKSGFRRAMATSIGAVIPGGIIWDIISTLKAL